MNLQPHGVGGFLRPPQCSVGALNIARIDKHGNTNGLGHQLMQECQPLGVHLLVEKIDAGRIATRARLATSPSLTGSSPTANTIGIVAVASLAAIEAAMLVVAMTAT